MSLAQIVNYQNDRGQSALHLAAGYGRLNVTQLLVQNGAAVNLSDTVGYTPLHLAAEGQWGVTGWEGTGGKHSQHADVVRFLLASGADSTLVDKFGRTALDVAANDIQIRNALQRSIVEGTSYNGRGCYVIAWFAQLLRILLC